MVVSHVKVHGSGSRDYSSPSLFPTSTALERTSLHFAGKREGEDGRQGTMGEEGGWVKREGG